MEPFLCNLQEEDSLAQSFCVGFGQSTDQRQRVCLVRSFLTSFCDKLVRPPATNGSNACVLTGRRRVCLARKVFASSWFDRRLTTDDEEFVAQPKVFWVKSSSDQYNERKFYLHHTTTQFAVKTSRREGSKPNRRSRDLQSSGGASGALETHVSRDGSTAVGSGEDAARAKSVGGLTAIVGGVRTGWGILAEVSAHFANAGSPGLGASKRTNLGGAERAHGRESAGVVTIVSIGALGCEGARLAATVTGDQGSIGQNDVSVDCALGASQNALVQSVAVADGEGSVVVNSIGVNVDAASLDAPFVELVTLDKVLGAVKRDGVGAGLTGERSVADERVASRRKEDQTEEQAFHCLYSKSR